MDNLRDRFWEKVDVGAPDECWEWTAYCDARGYGRFGVNGRPQRAHRVVWQLIHGPIPKGEHYGTSVVRHRCDNPSCVNPAHLEVGTQSDNVRDMHKRDRAGFGIHEINAAKTHCPQGHEYTPENTYQYASGRKCKTCVRKRVREAYHRRVREGREMREVA